MKRLAIGLIAFVLLPIAPVSAASQRATSGIAVSPAIKQLQVQSGQDETDFSEEITNNTPNPVQIKVGFADFKALNESGGIAFLGQNAGAVEQSHGLAKWVSISTQQVGLDSGQSAEVQIHLSDLGSLPEGGHYGAITYQVLKATPNGGGNRVNVNQVVSSLVFLTTAGKGTQHLKMPPPVLHHIEFSLPSELDVFFTNDGNTQTVPRGNLIIYSHDAAHPVATAVVNTQQAMVLPNSTRLLQTPITVTTHPWRPGRYHVHILYRPDATAKFSSYDASFFYINPLLFPMLLAIAVAAWYVLPRLWLHRSKIRPVTRLFARIFRRINRFLVEVILANIAYGLVKILDRKKTKTMQQNEKAGAAIKVVANIDKKARPHKKAVSTKTNKKAANKTAKNRPKKPRKNT